MNILEIHDLIKRYKGGALALDRLNVTVKKGQTIGVLGPNGAGKSSTINIIAGILRKDSGRVTYDGVEITESSYLYKRSVGFVLERPVYFEKLSGNEYLEFAGSMFGLDKPDCRKRADELLDYFDLREKQDAWIETYSNGMKKKISLAAALIHRPLLLILDEPLEGMDPISAVRTKELLVNIRRKGTSVVIASHQLDIVEKLCDDVAIIDKGRLVYQSPVSDVYEDGWNGAGRQTYHSLEELFVHVIAGENGTVPSKNIDWPNR